MAVEEWALVACVVFAGVWTGFLSMLTLILHPVMRDMDGGAWTRFLQSFLPVARKAWFNYLCVLGLIFSPAVALWTLDNDSTAFTLTLLGFLLTIIGPLLTSNRFAEPNYNVIESWDPDALPDDAGEVQRKYYLYNWVRYACTLGAFVLFFAALLDLLG
jgi:hypothetical protein